MTSERAAGENWPPACRSRAKQKLVVHIIGARCYEVIRNAEDQRSGHRNRQERAACAQLVFPQEIPRRERGGRDHSTGENRLCGVQAASAAVANALAASST